MIAAAHGVPCTPGYGTESGSQALSAPPSPPPHADCLTRLHCDGMSDQQWYFDTSSGEVTQGKTSGWDNRMGPYPSRDEAEHALQIARERTKAADEWDED